MTEDTMQVACFGQPGSYSDQAMQAWFRGRSVEASYCDHFEEVTAAVAEGRARYGVVPIENSSTGGITEVYDLIRKYRCAVVGEVHPHRASPAGAPRRGYRGHPHGLFPSAGLRPEPGIFPAASGVGEDPLFQHVEERGTGRRGRAEG